MAYNFPNAPSIGQVSSGFTWDGEKWVQSPSGVASDATKLNVAGSQTTTGGFRFTAYNGGTLTAGQTFTPNAYNSNYQYYTNNGGHTIAAPANDCALDIFVTNGATAGAIAFSGFTVGTVGDTLTVTNGHRFVISIRRVNAIATYVIKALQ